MSIDINEKSFTTWDDFEKELFTPEEIEESNQRVKAIGEKLKTSEDEHHSDRQSKPPVKRVVCESPIRA